MNDRLEHVNTPLFQLLLTLYSLVDIYIMCAHFVKFMLCVLRIWLLTLVPTLVGKHLMFFLVNT